MKLHHRPPFYLLLLLLLAGPLSRATARESAAHHPPVELVASGKPVSLRGLSAPGSGVVWASGEKGTIARSLDGGRTWSWTRVPGFSDRDFRSIQGFDARSAVVAAAGDPAVILHTTDGGKHWRLAYRNTAAGSFLDALAFWDRRRGLAFGDPLDGRLLVLSTADGGATWSELAADQRPLAAPREAGFAASGSALRVWGEGKALLATGGSRARLWVSFDFGRSWAARTCSIRQGSPSQGIFSVAVDGNDWVLVGGDYRRPDDRQGVACWSADGGATWSPPTVSPGGYRSAVEALGAKRFLATGPNGTDLSLDGGATWRSISAQGFHAIAREVNGDTVFLAGGGGRIGRFELARQSSTQRERSIQQPPSTRLP